MLELYNQIINELRSAWRFRWYGAALAWPVCVFGWFWAATLPNVYEAGARVYVDASSALRPLLQNRIVPPDVNDELSYVRQALLGREQLDRVARENGLDAGVTTDTQRQALLAQLGSQITIDFTGLGRDNPSSVYGIRYRNANRDTAIGVVSTLLNALVEDTLSAKREGMGTVETFLDERIQEYEGRLQGAEAALADFKRRNADVLPGAEGGYYARRAGQNEALEAARKSLQLAESRRNQLLDQLRSESPVMPNGAQIDAEPPPNSIDARIRNYRAELETLMLEYTERHPDVIATREILTQLEQQRAAQLAAVGVNDTNQEISSLSSNPIYQQLQIALNEVDVQIAELRADVQERRERLDQLQLLIDEVPEVEAELARLNRDYDVVYEQYHALIRSRETQDLSQKVSDTEQIDFRVIDPPFAAFQPVAPERLRLLTMVLFGGLMAAGALCYLLAQLKPVFVSTRALREIAGLPVVGAVTQVWVAGRGLRQRMELLTFAAVIAGLVLLFGIGVAIEQVGPGIHAFVGSV